MSDGKITGNEGFAIEIGGMPILLRTRDTCFRQLLSDRYAGFVRDLAIPEFEFDIDLVEPSTEIEADADVQVRKEGGGWLLQRGDFQAQWHTSCGRGQVRQAPIPYAIDPLLRMLPTRLL